MRSTVPARVLLHFAVFVACRALFPVETAAQERAISIWTDALRKPRPDGARGLTVQNVTLTRDAGALHFLNGQINLLQPIDGRTVGAVFVGEGVFELAAPDEVERAQLRRVYGKSAIAVPFTRAVLLFTDSTEAELARSGGWSRKAVPREVTELPEEAAEYFTDGDGRVARDVMRALVSDRAGWFYAHLSGERGDPTIFELDPASFEEVSVSTRSEAGKAREVVAQFHRKADYESGESPPQESLDLLKIMWYDVETTIAKDLRLTGRATLHVARAPAPTGWIPFHLFADLAVDSVRWADGTLAPVERSGEDVWVDFSDGGPRADSVTFFYRGKMLEQPSGLWVSFGSFNSWLPVYEFGREMPYHLVFHTPDRFVVNAVGRKTSETTEAGVTTTVWDAPPVRLMAFNLGEFESYESKVEGAPPLTVYLDEDAHRRLRAKVQGYLLTQDDMAEQVARDLRNSFRFFAEVYGATTADAFVATEIAAGHGEAYPGLVLLDWSTYQYTAENGFQEMFRAHEVAHQWWGIGVEPATYRDRWLAEGFAEFSGWWYAGRARGSVDLYRRRLKETREALLLRRDKAPPLGLGTRVLTAAHPDDYQLMVYEKGAWVLHMLRTMLTDPRDDSDLLFTTAMKNFYTQYLGGTATTRDFQKAVEQVVGVEMGWFFDEWVYGSAIPTYTFAYKLEDLPSGETKLTVRVRQDKATPGFRMPVPVLLDFGEGSSATVHVNVDGPIIEEVLTLPQHPRSVVFNPFESVLAETRTEGWR